MPQAIQRPHFDWLGLARSLYRRYPLHNRMPLALVALSMQRLYLIVRLHLLADFSISSSRFGAGCLLHFLRTPPGAHQVVDKLGDGAPLFSRFRFRHRDGTRAQLNPYATIGDGDAICTRIIRLAGLEKGRNLGGCFDSYRRCIYIHGTPDEKRIGRPASIGCIRMNNRDVCEVYQRLEIGSLVYVVGS